MLEKNIESRLVAKVKNIRGIALKLSPFTLIGIPDRVILLPKGRILFVELKTKGGRLSKIQNNIQKKLTTMGFEVINIWEAEQVDVLISRINENK